MWYRFTLFVALVASALALGGALAHAYELLNKMPLPRDEYFIAQQLYAGWNQLAVILSVQATALIALVVRTHRDRRLFPPAVVALAALAAAQAAFWIWTFPANQATADWTTITEGWEALRRQWEYSHLVGAGFQLIAFLALVWLALARVPEPACLPRQAEPRP